MKSSLVIMFILRLKQLLVRQFASSSDIFRWNHSSPQARIIKGLDEDLEKSSTLGL